MGRGRGQRLCVLWGGVALGVGTLAYALFSSSSPGCSTNVVVITRSAVTARGCATFSIISHLGVGLMVLGAVLLLGSFALAVRNRRQPPDATASAVAGHAVAPTPVADTGDEPDRLFDPETAPSTVIPLPVASPESAPMAPVAAVAPRPAPVGPVPPGPVTSATPPGDVEPALAGESHEGDARTPGPAIQLPPGWYGNPNTPGKPVQWWDGTRLTDRREV